MRQLVGQLALQEQGCLLLHHLQGITGREANLDDVDIEELTGRLLVVDEMSMVIQLFATLLSAVRPDQVILVGNESTTICWTRTRLL